MHTKKYLKHRKRTRKYSKKRFGGASPAINKNSYITKLMEIMDKHKLPISVLLLLISYYKIIHPLNMKLVNQQNQQNKLEIKRSQYYGSTLQSIKKEIQEEKAAEEKAAEEKAAAEKAKQDKKNNP